MWPKGEVQKRNCIFDNFSFLQIKGRDVDDTLICDNGYFLYKIKSTELILKTVLLSKTRGIFHTYTIENGFTFFFFLANNEITSVTLTTNEKSGHD